MNWPWTKMYAIRVEKTYNGKVQPELYKIDNLAKIEKTIHHISTNNKLYRETTMDKDGLNFLPTLNLKRIEEAHPTEENITIIAVLQYSTPKVTFKTNKKKKFSFGPTLALLMIISVVFSFMWVLNQMENEHEERVINRTCFMYTKAGVPDYIEISGTKYQLKEDGTFTEASYVFLNPYHRQLLAQQECVKVNIK